MRGDTPIEVGELTLTALEWCRRGRVKFADLRSFVKAGADPAASLVTLAVDQEWYFAELDCPTCQGEEGLVEDCVDCEGTGDLDFADDIEAQLVVRDHPNGATQKRTASALGITAEECREIEASAMANLEELIRRRPALRRVFDQKRGR